MTVLLDNDQDGQHALDLLSGKFALMNVTKKLTEGKAPPAAKMVVTYDLKTTAAPAEVEAFEVGLGRESGVEVVVEVGVERWSAGAEEGAVGAVELELSFGVTGDSEPPTSSALMVMHAQQEAVKGISGASGPGGFVVDLEAEGVGASGPAAGLVAMLDFG